jgi:hypothetical protein
MTNGDIRIEVISKLTGDPKLRVAAVVNLMRDLMKGEGDNSLEEKITPSQATALRRKLKNDKGLIDWYNQGRSYCKMFKL